ncbi:hypothetical protein RSAG8_12691, partial [Rhizoctonia solani AG-8 WAC10335]
MCKGLALAIRALIILADNPLTQSQLDELVALEFAMEEANPAVQHLEPQPDSKLEQLRVQLEEEIQDSADTYTVPRKSGELLSYDGSFQLVRKNKVIDHFDTSLTDRLMYIVAQDQYRTNLIANKDTAYEQANWGAGECNNHRAANDTWVQKTGIAETGQGAVTCTQHTVFMPQGSVNYWKGERVGRLDAEGCERAWANLNGASGSTSEKGPGARIDSLNYTMNDWNWRKMFNMVAFLLKKWREAARMGIEQEEAWLVVHENLPRHLIREWEDLNRKESEKVMCEGGTEVGVTAPTWLSEGIDIERLQGQLHKDVKSYSNRITPHQSLEVTAWCMSLNSCLVLHQDHSELFINIKVTTPNQLGSLAEETNREPEHWSLHLPSHLKSRLSGTECLENLHRIRTGTSHKLQMLMGKEKNACGEVANTCTQTAIMRLTIQIKHATDDYNASYKGLLALGVSQEQALPLQHLKSTDFDGLMSILCGERGLGEGTRKLPWFWSICTLEPGQESPLEDEELTEAICMEWFCGCEHFR